MNRSILKYLLVAVLCAALLFVCVASALAVVRPKQPPLANTDQRIVLGQKGPALTGAKALAADRIKTKVSGVSVELDRVLGTPRYVGSPDAFLTGAKGKGGAVSDAVADTIPETDKDRPVKAFLKEYAQLFGHGPEVLDQAAILMDRSNDRGVRKVAWQQQVDGILVHRATLVANITSNGELINLSSTFVPDPVAAADAGVPDRKELAAKPTIPAARAVALAATSIGETTDEKDVTRSEAEPKGPEKAQSFTGDVIIEKAEAKLTWLPVTSTSLRLCWNVTLAGKSTHQPCSILVDASNGDILMRENHTRFLSAATWYMFDESPQPMLPGWSTPQTTLPPVVSRTPKTWIAWYQYATPEGWIPDTYPPDLQEYNNMLCGNNWCEVSWIQGDPYRVFNPPLTLDSNGDFPSYTQYWNASYVNVFYWSNLYHDTLHLHGFNEAAGNYQHSNYNRGGQGYDCVRISIRDEDWPNNAVAWYSATDGYAPLIEMGLFYDYESYPTQYYRDSSMDASVLLHEYTHLVSDRVAGTIYGNMSWVSAGVFEGWSDYFALSMLSKPYDDNLNGYNGAFPMGSYSTASWRALADFHYPYYFGVRRFPYSVDPTKNPLTIADIDPNQFNVGGVPYNAYWNGQGNLYTGEPHNTGEIWCSLLWDMRANLIARNGDDDWYPFHLAYLGMDLCASDEPTFIEARDALLQADTVYTSGQYHQEIWEACAKRGLGEGAVCDFDWNPFYGFSGTITDSYVVPLAANTVATPTYSQPGCIYDHAVQVAISCATAGAVIHYTTDGSIPTENSPTYVEPVWIGENCTLYAKAWKTGMNPSGLRQNQYKIINTCAMPVFSPSGGTPPLTVWMSCATEGATIHYTLDNNEPTEASPTYNASTGVPLPSCQTVVKARAWKDTLSPSGIRRVFYTGIVQKPYFDQPSGTYDYPRTLTVTCGTADATLHYTTNGDDPDESDPTVANGGTIAINQSMTVKARGWKTCWEPSPIRSATYTMKVATPIFSADSGTYAGTQISVTVNCLTPGATIHYTTNGNDPQETDPVVANGGSVNVLSSAPNLKAKAFLSGWTTSDTKSATYAFVTVKYVDKDCTNPTHNGQSWATAYLTIQEGLTAASSGQEVWVADGTYTERITLKAGVGLYGGFASGEIAREQRNVGANLTAINGSSGGQVVTAPSGATNTCKIDGFKIYNGSSTQGAGIYCAGSSPTIANNVITGNTGTSMGGGIYCSGSAAYIVNNVIYGNSASTSGYGAGIYITGTTVPTVINNTIAANNANTNRGSGIYINSGNPTIKNNVIASNSDGGIARGGGSPIITYNNVWGNSPNYYNITDPTGTNGNISADPTFVNSGGYDYHLLGGSPCIDAATLTGAPATDREGTLRPQDGNGSGADECDMGAYELQAGMTLARFNKPDGTPVKLTSVSVIGFFASMEPSGRNWAYVEPSNRAWGIRVSTTQTLTVDAVVNVKGTLQTDFGTGERYILADTGYPQAAGGTNQIKALGMRNQWIGGAASGYAPTISNGFGFYNAGMLVQTWGYVCGDSPTHVYINDGSDLSDGCGWGLRVVKPSGVGSLQQGSYVRVTGVVQVMAINDVYIRYIVPRTSSDFETITSWHSDYTPLVYDAWNYVSMPGIPKSPDAEYVFYPCEHEDRVITLDGNLDRWEARYQYWAWYFHCPPCPFGNCLVGEGFRFFHHVEEGDPTWCYELVHADVSGDQFLSLPMGSATLNYYSLLGNPFPTDKAWASMLVTDGVSVLTLPQAVNAGWIRYVRYWTGSSWQNVTDLSTGSMQIRKAYQIYPKYSKMALYIPAQ